MLVLERRRMRRRGRGNDQREKRERLVVNVIYEKGRSGREHPGLTYSIN